MQAYSFVQGEESRRNVMMQPLPQKGSVLAIIPQRENQRTDKTEREKVREIRSYKG